MSRITPVRIAPAEGQLNPADITHYVTTRDANHVVPWLALGPAPGEVWRVDAIFVTNIGAVDALFSISIAPTAVTRAGGTPPGSLIQYGNSIYPVSCYAWGRTMPAGDSDGIETGGEVIRGNLSLTDTTGYGIWLGASPGVNLNSTSDATSNDGTPAGIMMTVHAERLA